LKFRHLSLLAIFIFINACISKHDREKRVNKRYPTNNTELVDIKNELEGINIEDKNLPPDKTEEKKKSLEELYPKLVKSVFIVYSFKNEMEYAQGSGFMIAPNIGITNYHVLREDWTNVILKDENYYRIVKILNYSESENLDYVIFQTEFETTEYLKISSESPKIGEDIFAIGIPKGLENSLTKGAISAFRSNNRIQIDATIDHGSSGGPLFNLHGEVIGITSSGLGTGSDLNFAIDIQALPYKEYIKK
jgi:serine protease Do